MKPCFVCTKMKPLSEFYAHKKMADGHVNKCKTCYTLAVRKYRRENDSVREYDRMRYYRDGKMKKRIAESTPKWVKNNPLARKAHSAISNAIRDGKLTRQPCRICGNPKSHAHHEDYSKPFDVDWLCALHHQRHHADDAD